MNGWAGGSPFLVGVSLIKPSFLTKSYRGCRQLNLFQRCAVRPHDVTVFPGNTGSPVFPSHDLSAVYSLENLGRGYGT